MRRPFALIGLLALCEAALYLVERRKHPDAVSANAVVSMAADWQRDLSRVPLHLTRLSDEEEIRIGDALAEQYTSSRSPANPEQRATEQYINQVGARDATHARRRLLYRFCLIPDRDLINAFALPGGHVCVGQGLLDKMMSEDEFAFVLCHEVEHIDHYHTVERVQIEAQLKNLHPDILADVAEFPMSLWQTGYCKDEECEADREGLRIALAAAYSAQGALDQLVGWAKLPTNIWFTRRLRRTNSASSLSKDLPAISVPTRSRPSASHRLRL